jgi:hypothetical protein
MATGHTSISDIIVPELFTSYALKETEEKSRLIRSGAVVSDGDMAAKLNGGGLTFNMPTYDDLDNDEERVSDESQRNTFAGGVVDPEPNKIATFNEVAVRLERNNSWTATQLSKLLSGDDPAAAIQSRVANYWVRRQQACFVNVVNGIFADNAAAPAGTEHVQNDMTNDISGGAYAAGVTDFSAEAFIDTTLTMGDSMEDLSMIMVHSVVYARMLKNNLIDFVSDSINNLAITVPTFLGREVIIDDGLPAAAGVYESWVFGAGAIIFAQGSPDKPTAIDDQPGAGNGAGQEILYNRVRWGFHPKGHAYAGATPAGGPSNAVLSGAASWARVFPERKQVKIARLISREA